MSPLKRIKYDGVGIPIVSREDIEVWSEKFISFFDDNCLQLPMPTPLGTICTALRDEHKVNFAFDADLGVSPEGYQYRGRFHIPSTTIYLDKSLEYGDPRFNFTLAHELAHFVMHKKVSLGSIKVGDSEISDTNRSLILDHVHSDNPREWLEWQANKFASSLVLPRKTLPIAVVAIQKTLGISRQGMIYLDRQPANISMFYSIVETLMKLYETSKSSIKLRLKELGILVEADTGFEARSRSLESINSTMKNMFQNMSSR